MPLICNEGYYFIDFRAYEKVSVELNPFQWNMFSVNKNWAILKEENENLKKPMSKGGLE